MNLKWPESLGEPFPAWTWYAQSILDKRDTSFKLDAADAVIVELLHRLEDITEV